MINNNKDRVVITGVGLITPLGNSPHELFSNLQQHRTAIGPVTKFNSSKISDTNPFTAAEIINFDITDFGISSRDARTLSLFQKYALAATELAILDAGIVLPRQDIHNAQKSSNGKEDIGLVVGTAFPPADELGKEYKKLFTRGPRYISPHVLNMNLPNSATSVISIRFGIRGPILTVTGASVSGNDAIMVAFDKLQNGRSETMIVSGTDVGASEFMVSSFYRNQAGSKSGFCRPFDLRRDGTVMGEGAATLVLENLNHAIRRNAKIYGEIFGYGHRSDAYDMTDIPKNTAGLISAIKESLITTNISSERIGYINAHGTGTYMNDLSETLAIKTVFGDNSKNIFINSLKGGLGHMLGAAGIVETVITLMICDRKIILPTVGYEIPDPLCDLNYVAQAPSHLIDIDKALSIGVGMGGSNSVLVLGAFK